MGQASSVYLCFSFFMLYRLILILSYCIIVSYLTESSSPTASMSEHRNLSEESLTNNKNSKPQQPQPKEYRYKTPNPPGPSTISKTGDFRKEWKVQPGYSSGASSFSGSDAGSMDGDFENGGYSSHTKALEVSRHSDILDLSTMRQEMMAEGDLTKTVVRIEVRNRFGSGFGAPATRGFSILLTPLFLSLSSHSHSYHLHTSNYIIFYSDSIRQTD